MNKNKLSILLILLFFSCFACKNAALENPIPQDVIPVDSLVMVLTDISVMEKVIQKDYPHLVRNTDIIRNSGDSILKNYHLSFSRYKKSLEYYTRDMDTMNYIYDKIADRATILMNELD